MKKDDTIVKRYPTAQENHTQVTPSRLDASTKTTKRKQVRLLKDNPASIEVKVRPNIETINEDAYFVMARTMERMAQKMAEGKDLNPVEVSSFQKMADILVKMRREDRMSLGNFEDELEKMSDEEQAELARQMAEELAGDDEAA